jgi:gas vesicle protein GvpG
MDLLTLLFRLPLMPLRGFIRLGEVLQEQAERELRDPASVRRQLEQAQQAHESGEISEDDLADVEGQAVDRLLTSPGKAVSPGTGTPRWELN